VHADLNVRRKLKKKNQDPLIVLICFYKKMRTSQLQQQLAKLRERPENFTFKQGVNRNTKYSKGLSIDSLLYEPKEAALYDVYVMKRLIVYCAICFDILFLPFLEKHYDVKL
jgi:hypothetical protein